MQLHELKNPLKRKTKRVGRGGKRGTYSGRGQKGQKSRAGHRIKPAERELLMRLPKLRGVKHKALKPKPAILNVKDLAMFDESAINKKLLLDKGYVRNLRGRVKILGDGEVKKTFTIEGLEVSEKAREKIEKAGGRVIADNKK